MADNGPEITEELAVAPEEVARLKEEKETLRRELETRDAAVAGLEQAVADRDGELAVLREKMVAADRQLAEAGDSLFRAVASYREQVTAANPEIPGELITGDTIEAVDRSLENARALVARVKQSLEDETARANVPAGAPQRAPFDLSMLSPREKIQYAIGGNG